jgi:mycobactin peptide synthetase MbtE
MGKPFQPFLLQQLHHFADRPAIICGDSTLTYATLLVQANAVTRLLLEQAPSPGERVVVAVKKRADFISTLIGCMNARCCCVPIDPALPPDRLRNMLDRLQPRLVLTTTADEPLPIDTATILLLDQLLPDAEVQTIAYPAFEADDNLYLYHTSGSTGIPKGILGRNASLLQFLEWEIATLQLTSDVRVSQLVSPYFDASLRDIFIPLLCGGAICLPPGDNNALSPDELAAWINTTGINLIHCVPSVFRLLQTAQLASTDFKALQYILLSGEKIIPAELSHWYQLFGERIQLINLYGATESTMIRTYYPIRPEDAQAAAIPIGKPIADTEIWIVNDNGQPCKKLVPGEIWIVSAFISNGYFNDDALNREKFITVTLPDGSTQRAFKTGDTGRILPDGNIDLLGRTDRMIKLNGIRVEPGEIENALLQSEAVAQALVLLHTTGKDTEELIAFVQCREQNPTNEEKLLTQIKLLLPTYMIPARIVVVAEFPLLANGKTDQRALMAMIAVTSITAPANATEEKVLAIWKELLGDKAISTTASFQSLGGNSIAIMRLIGKIYNEFKVRITLNELFSHLTIQKQAAYIAKKDKDSALVIQKAVVKPAYVLSAAQERVYYNYALNPHSTSYNLPMTWEIQRNFDKAKIDTGIRQLIQRHETLRTSFHPEGDTIVQVIHDELPFEIEEMTAPADGIDEAIAAFIRPFDLAKAPLLRTVIITTTDNRKILAIDLHHIICDGMSQAILLADFEALSRGVVLPPLAFQYKDYAEWEKGFRQKEEYIALRQFWLQPFDKPLPVLTLPTTNTIGNTVSEKGGSIVFEISKASVAPLLGYLKEKEITTFAGLFSLYFMFIARITGQEDLVIGTVASGRMQQETEGVSGMFVKTLPIRFTVDPYMPVATMMANLHQYLVRATSTQAYDLSDIIIELNKNRKEAITKLFDLVFVFQNYNTGGESREDDITRYEYANTDSKYPITLFAEEKETLFRFRWEYSGSFFTLSDSQWLTDQFTALVLHSAEDFFAPIMNLISTKEAVAAPLVEDDISFNF